MQIVVHAHDPYVDKPSALFLIEQTAEASAIQKATSVLRRKAFTKSLAQSASAITRRDPATLIACAENRQAHLRVLFLAGFSWGFWH